MGEESGRGQDSVRGLIIVMDNFTLPFRIKSRIKSTALYYWGLYENSIFVECNFLNKGGGYYME